MNRKKVIILLFGMVIILLFFLLLYFRYFGVSNSTPVSNNQVIDNNYPDFGNAGNNQFQETIESPISNKETISDLIEKYGNPTKNYEDEVYLFNSESQYGQKEAVFEDDNLVFFSDPDPEMKTYSEIVSFYGEPESVLFGPRSEKDDNLYNYTSLGISFIGNKRLNSVSEIWYYNPISLEELKTSWAVGYEETKEEADVHTYPF